MAGYNEILTGRLNRALQKALSMKGSASLNELSSVLYVNVNLLWGQETRFLEDWNRFGFSTTTGPFGAGTTSGVRLRNPQNSGQIGVIEKITVWDAGVTNYQSVRLQVGFPGLSDMPAGSILTTSVASLDARFYPFGVPSSQNPFPLSTGTGSFGTVIWEGGTSALVAPGTLSNPVDVILDESQHLVLSPGMSYDLVGTTLNQAFNFSIWWRARAMEESEKR
jgi:hypothetical protein